MSRNRVKVEGNGRVWNFLELISEAYKYEFSLERFRHRRFEVREAVWRERDE